jgi:CheY-like chemotaxis protein
MPALVLIVDADPHRREVAARLVEQEGAVAVPAASSSEAMLVFVRREPCLTILQIDPSNGLDLRLCRDMKALKAGMRREVVVVASGEWRSAAFDSRCDAFVRREPETLPLRRAISRYLARVKPSIPAEIELLA